MTSAILLVAAYLIGSIPTSFLAGRLRGIDLRKHGSGNLGATNAYRVLGWKAAVPIFAADALKGFIPAYLFPGIDASNWIGWPLAYGAAAILGHVFSIFVGFRGGKGVATGAGVFLALAPAAVGVALIIWSVLVLTTGYVSVASIGAAIALPILVAWSGAAQAVLILSIALSLFVIYAHRSNVRRLLRGEEHRFRGLRRRPERTP